MNNLYRDNILDHFKNPRNFGKMDNPDISYGEDNPLCGDRIEVQIKFKNQFRSSGSQKSRSKIDIERNEKVISIIQDIKFCGEGCAISMASASMLTEEVKGKSIEEIKKLNRNNILNLLGIELTPTRLKCALLPLEILEKSLTLAKKK